MAKSKAVWQRDPVREARAVAALRESYAAFASDEELFLDAIEGETDFLEILDNILLAHVETVGLIEGSKEAIARLTDRKRRLEKRAETQRALIEQALAVAEISAAIERPMATISLASKPPSLIVLEESEIPTTFFKTADPVLDRKELLAALKTRAEAAAADPEHPPPPIPGATLSNGGFTLQIRTR